MGNYKWNNNDSDVSLPYIVVLMISRNKDNKDIPNFKERRNAFLHTNNLDYIQGRFEDFCSRGVPGELCRLYTSVNARNISKVRHVMLHELIDKENFNPDYIEPWVAGIAARKENAAENKWMFDLDMEDPDELNDFVKDISTHIKDDYELYRTPNGYAVVVNKHFDTRDILKKWEGKVSLKRDDLLCWDWVKANC